MAKINDREGKEYKKLIIVSLIAVVILGVFILYLAWPLLTGTTIILDTRPIDPFDPLRGQYMTLNYEISIIPKIEKVNPGDSVFVSLKEDNGIWRLSKASTTKPDTGVFIKGTIKSVGTDMRVEYGIEQFFFERNADVPTRNLTVKAKVDSSGHARIVGLLENNKPVNIIYKEVSITS